MKRADFAGSWYPESRSECRRMIDAFDRELMIEIPGYGESPGGSHPDHTETPPVAIVAPHAGWIFSGSTAWAAIRATKDTRPDRIVIFGGHLGPGERPRIMRTDGWKTPFGGVSADKTAIEALMAAAEFEVETDLEYRRDNGVELVLALVAGLGTEIPLITIGAPPTADAVTLGRTVRDTLSLLDGETIPSSPSRTTLWIASTDLTHYGPGYGFTPHGTGFAALKWSTEENDAAFLDRTCAADAKGAIASAAKHSNACCPGAVAAALTAADAKRGEILRATTSHARSGGTPVDFVGYGAVALYR